MSPEVFSFTDVQIGQWVGMHLWPLFRMASFLMIVPIFGTQLVSTRFRLALALLITMVIVPVLPPVDPVEPLSLAAWAIIAEQILVGLFLGFCVLLLFQLFIVSGQMMAMMMGLGFAAMMDPTNGIQVTALSQFYMLVTTLVFLAMNGHLVMFETLVESFYVLPIGSGGFSLLSWQDLAMRVSWLFASGLMIALPGITALLIVNISLGVITKAAPQMNIFSIGFPLTVVMGLVIFWVSTAGLLPQFQGLTEQTFTFMREQMMLNQAGI